MSLPKKMTTIPHITGMVNVTTIFAFLSIEISLKNAPILGPRSGVSSSGVFGSSRDDDSASVSCSTAWPCQRRTPRYHDIWSSSDHHNHVARNATHGFLSDV